MQFYSTLSNVHKLGFFLINIYFTNYDFFLLIIHNKINTYIPVVPIYQCKLSNATL